MGYEQSHHKMVPTMKTCLLFLFLLCVPHVTRAVDKLTLEIEGDELMKTGDLEQAETKDASATEIIKQIRKVNPDGTYTIGFEADDGTFKIETRDLQGNVKQGTYGYIQDGQIKRVSYSTQNNTLTKNIVPSLLDEPREDNENENISPASSLRYNRTFASTTRRPTSLSYLTSTGSPTIKPSVIQSIPKRRILLPSERTTLRSSLEASKVPIEGTTTVIYATSVPTPKPYLTAGATERSDKVEIDQVERKVYISTSKVVTTMKPILSKDQNLDKVDFLKRGNNLRRQLKPEDEAIEQQEAQQQILYGSGDESPGIYGGGFGSVRPLFTTSSPKVPVQVLAARQRAAQLQNILSNSAAKTTTEKISVRNPKRQNAARIKLEDVTETVTENRLAQAPVGEQISESEVGVADERRIFQRPLPPQLENVYRPRNYLRHFQQQEFQNLQPTHSRDPRFGDLRLNDPPLSDPLLNDPLLNNPLLNNPRLENPRLAFREPQGVEINERNELPISSSAQRFSQQYQSPQGQQSFSEQPEESFPAPLQFLPQRNSYDYDRPLTVRDFEKLLQLLVFRQQQSPPFRINPYYPPSNPQNYAPFIPGYNQPYSQIPRPPFFNPVSSGLYDPGYQNPYYSSSVPVGQRYQGGGNIRGQVSDGMFQASQQTLQPNLNQNFEVQRVMSRRRQYDQRLFPQQTQVPSPPSSEQEINYNALQSPASENYLPSSVREQLLYRMLMLAIRSDSQYANIPSPAASSDSQTVLEPEQQEANTVTTNANTSSRKPVRSVQILGEESSEK